MTDLFEPAMRALFSGTDPFFDAQAMFSPDKVDSESMVGAFLLALGGDEAARSYLNQQESDPTAAFFRT